jgi:hypothetical protein
VSETQKHAIKGKEVFIIKKNLITKRICAVLLSLVMLVGILPLAALADTPVATTISEVSVSSYWYNVNYTNIKLTFKAKVTDDSSGETLKNVPLEFYLGDTYIGTATTDPETSIATLTFNNFEKTTAFNELTYGKYDLIVKYAGGTVSRKTYAASEATVKKAITVEGNYFFAIYPNGGIIYLSGSPIGQITYYGTSGECTIYDWYSGYPATFSKEGYTLVGWSKNADASTAEYTDNTRLDEISDGRSGTVYLYAVWKLTQSITASNITLLSGQTGKSVIASSDGDGTLSYEVTSGSDVVSIDASTGAITTLKTGKATVTISAAETVNYAPATKEITVTVEECTHSWGDWTVTKNATCKEAGKKQCTCSICGENKTEIIPKLTTHTYGDWETVTEATCKAAGLERRTCAVCGIAYEEREIPKLTSHTYGDWETVTEATCKAAGLERHTCAVCGNDYDEREIPKLTNHTYGDWETVTEATYEAAGLKKRICQVCGHEETEEIPQLVKATYQVTSGNGQSWTKSGGKTLTFTCNGEYEKFSGLKIDGVLVDPSNYDTAKGSTIVTLKASYVKTLSDGNHTIQFIYSDGKSDTVSFTVKAEAAADFTTSQTTPQTGDNSNIFLWLAMTIVSGSALIGICFFGIKKRYSK